jgi:hypothetical protein
MADLADAIAEKLHIKKDESEEQSSSSSDEDDKVMATLSTLLEDEAFECVAGAECQLADAKCKPKGKKAPTSRRRSVPPFDLHAAFEIQERYVVMAVVN